MATRARPVPHPPERHRSHRAGWLRAAVLGADDGIVSTASLMLGVAAAQAPRTAIVTAGLAGLAAGALSMAAGEYVSVSSQRDAERADLARERQELQASPKEELAELTGLYVARGLDEALARQVAIQLTAHDALAAHARDELGLSATSAARPTQAAATSATAFTAGAALPIVALIAAPYDLRAFAIVAVAVASLALLGWIGAAVGGAGGLRATVRVVAGGCLAMAITAGVGFLTHTVAG